MVFIKDVMIGHVMIGEILLPGKQKRKYHIVKSIVTSFWDTQYLKKIHSKDV